MPNYPAPVIFLPGIMGSALRDEYPVAPENVWSILKAATKNYERITLHPDDLNFEVVEPARVVKDHAFELFYRDLIEELRHNLTLDPDEPVPSDNPDERLSPGEFTDDGEEDHDELMGRDDYKDYGDD